MSRDDFCCSYATQNLWRAAFSTIKVNIFHCTFNSNEVVMSRLTAKSTKLDENCDKLQLSTPEDDCSTEKSVTKKERAHSSVVA